MGISLVLWRFLKSCLIYSKVKLDQMVMSMILKLTKNQTIWYGVNVPCTSLRIMLTFIYAMSSPSTSAYRMFNTSIINFMFWGGQKLQPTKNHFQEINGMNWFGWKRWVHGVGILLWLFKNFVFLLAQSSTNWLASIEEWKVGVSLHPLLILFSIKKNLHHIFEIKEKCHLKKLSYVKTGIWKYYNIFS